jgi:hypothetical protein
MIRMILQNNNDTILSAILLWKSNIDKQFEGIIILYNDRPWGMCRLLLHYPSDRWNSEDGLQDVQT